MNLQAIFLHKINHILISVRRICRLSHHGKDIIMILNVRKHTGKMSLHGFFVICLCHMAKIRIVQKRQIWIFFSVPAYAHS